MISLFPRIIIRQLGIKKGFTSPTATRSFWYMGFKGFWCVLMDQWCSVITRFPAGCVVFTCYTYATNATRTCMRRLYLPKIHFYRSSGSVTKMFTPGHCPEHSTFSKFTYQEARDPKQLLKQTDLQTDQH